MSSTDTQNSTDTPDNSASTSTVTERRGVRLPIIDDYGTLVGYRELPEPSAWRT